MARIALPFLLWNTSWNLLWSWATFVAPTAAFHVLIAANAPRIHALVAHFRVCHQLGKARHFVILRHNEGGQVAIANVNDLVV
jgi:hypothetical protein